MFKLESDALPGVKRYLPFVVELDIKRVHMFSQHPEPGGKAAKDNTVDI
jgi:hypothetical protein